MAMGQKDGLDALNGYKREGLRQGHNPGYQKAVFAQKNKNEEAMIFPLSQCELVAYPRHLLTL
jgi:hypothetical protein